MNRKKKNTRLEKFDRVACPQCGTDHNVTAKQKSVKCICESNMKILRQTLKGGGQRVWLEEKHVQKSRELREAEDARDGIG